MDRNREKFLNLGFFVAMVIVNIMAAIGVLGGIKTKDVSGMYPSLITPAAMSFSIWGVIYTLLLVMIIAQMRSDETDMREGLNSTFFISCIVNIAWLFAWQFRMIGLSFVLIAILLALLLRMLFASRKGNLLLTVPIGIYTGWINVAALANLGVLYAKNGWHWLGISNMTWAVTALIAGIVFMAFVIGRTKNISYSLASAWAYAGIAIAGKATVIRVIAITGAIFLVVYAVLHKISHCGNCKCGCMNDEKDI